MPDEAVDHVARASIEAHRATCEQIYKLHDERFINNSLDHKEIKHTMKELAREARKRWWWLLTAMVCGLAAIAWSLLRLRWIVPDIA